MPLFDQVMEVHLGFRTSSPNHENGFVAAAIVSSV
jgi:hypothetical protein